jgi:tetratricopeptide (TPR) repeat protein
MTDDAKKRPRRARAGAPTTPDPVEIAMEAEARGDAPGVATTLLTENVRLVREQIGLARNERFRNRIKAVRDGALTLLALFAVATVGVVVWDARQADGVVIEPLAVSSSLAEAGVDGDAVTRALLDRLAEMQAASGSTRAQRRAVGGGDAFSMEIPQTGLSVSEALRLLRRRIGQETVVTGEIARDATGREVLNLRIDGVPATLPAGDPTTTLSQQVDQAAEAVFAHTDAYRYAVWLGEFPDRAPEGDRLLNALTLRGPSEERAWAYVGLSVSARGKARYDRAIALSREAIRLDPLLYNAHANLAFDLGTLGNAEAALHNHRAALSVLNKGGSRYVDTNSLRWETERAIALLLNDFGAVLEISERRTEHAESDAAGIEYAADRRSALNSLHDLTGASQAGETVPTAASPFDDINRALDQMETTRDWGTAERHLATITDEMLPPAYAAVLNPVLVWPLHAYVLARLGRLDEARVLAARSSTTAIDALYARAWVAELGGQHGEADRWFAALVRRTPSLPRGYSAWGEAKLARGDFDGAIVQFREASRRGPNWADPLKFHGDALAGKGDHRSAVGKYRAAARLAPRWGALHLAWGQALAAQGRAQAARDKYREAAGLDLSAADRIAVTRLLAARA